MAEKELLKVRPNKKIYREDDKLIKLFDHNIVKKSEVLKEAYSHALVEETGLSVPKLLYVNNEGEDWAIATEYINGNTIETLMKNDPDNKKKYGQKLSEQDWENLKEQIDSACPNWQTAIQDVETLKKAEIETCYLSFLNISIKSEAMLLGINPDSANKRRLRTRQSLGLTNSKTGIYEFIIRKTLENIVI